MSTPGGSAGPSRRSQRSIHRGAGGPSIYTSQLIRYNVTDVRGQPVSDRELLRSGTSALAPSGGSRKRPYLGSSAARQQLGSRPPRLTGGNGAGRRTAVAGTAAAAPPNGRVRGGPAAAATHSSDTISVETASSFSSGATSSPSRGSTGTESEPAPALVPTPLSASEPAAAGVGQGLAEQPAQRLEQALRPGPEHGADEGLQDDSFLPPWDANEPSLGSGGAQLAAASGHSSGCVEGGDGPAGEETSARSGGSGATSGSCGSGPARSRGRRAAVRRSGQRRGLGAASQAAAGQAGASAEDEEEEGDDSDPLVNQRDWKLEAFGEDTSSQGRIIREQLRRVGHRGMLMWRSVKFLESPDDSTRFVTYRYCPDVPTESYDGTPAWFPATPHPPRPSYTPAAGLLCSVGDSVVLPWEREHDRREPVAPAVILAFVQRADGLVVTALRWADFWEDIVGKPDDPVPIPDDEALRGQNRIFIHKVDLANPDHLRFMYNEGTPAYIIQGHCKMMHRADVEEAYGSVEEYEKQEDVWVPLAGSLGQHAIEIAALHSSTSEADELGMVDVFGGAGCVSLGFKKAGFQWVFGVEQDKDAFTAYSRNLYEDCYREQPGSVAFRPQPLAERRVHHQALTTVRPAAELSLQALADTKAGKPGYPRPGQVAHLHFSPPCQDLSSINKKPTLEDVKLKVLAIADQYFRAVFRVAGPGTDKVTVRPWLRVCAGLLRMGYQVDWRLLLATNFGAANHRLRCWMLAAQSGYELPQPPVPRYFTHADKVCYARLPGYDDRMLDSLGDKDEGGWKSLLVIAQARRCRMQSIQPESLPAAVTVEEAIGDLPALVGLGGGRGWGDMRYPDPSGKPYPWKDAAPTVCSKDNAALCPCIHPKEQRVLSVQEKMRLQGIPDSFHLASYLSKQYLQVGNAVPVPMAVEIASVCFKALTGQDPPYQLPLLKGFVGGVPNPERAAPQRVQQAQQAQQAQQQEDEADAAAGASPGPGSRQDAQQQAAGARLAAAAGRNRTIEQGTAGKRRKRHQPANAAAVAAVERKERAEEAAAKTQRQERELRHLRRRQGLPGGGQQQGQQQQSVQVVIDLLSDSEEEEQGSKGQLLEVGSSEERQEERADSEEEGDSQQGSEEGGTPTLLPQEQQPPEQQQEADGKEREEKGGEQQQPKQQPEPQPLHAEQRRQPAPCQGRQQQAEREEPQPLVPLAAAHVKAEPVEQAPQQRVSSSDSVIDLVSSEEEEEEEERQQLHQGRLSPGSSITAVSSAAAGVRASRRSAGVHRPGAPAALRGGVPAADAAAGHLAAAAAAKLAAAAEAVARVREHFGSRAASPAHWGPVQPA
ncbi:hypothetical protein CHLNCDRAFT_50474 [Chlorella variabilis]|uniref:DNA (cytosine-5-)-methyltransferase n=1 Tax=Chlorella variabilis TaxID=554065 RepID=E1Z6H4_CHLVA|nr:hypothetical protein CHLNCDRAFT_50474 [Chlorella variabilis]EFN58649.1 hypothetical protein CHLNCDRAFT_50474 [Chlorella variabilis]|eukprot:XP_005850751.1 hypothetical protein CHLNCDRAFT_50474 [Chlorella variabilis]